MAFYSPLISKMYPLLDPEIADSFGRTKKHLLLFGAQAKMATWMSESALLNRNMREASPADFAKRAPSLGSFLPSRKVLRKLMQRAT